MSNLRRLARERLEIYLVCLLLAYRHRVFFVGLFLLMYPIAALLSYPLTGFAGLVIAMYLLLLSNSYGITLYTARLGAWIGMLDR